MRRKDKSSESSPEYQPYFTTYAKLTKPRKEIFEIIKKNFDMPKPLKMELFKIKDPDQWCQFHKSKGHQISDCLQLKDILKKMVRQGELN
jgi:hypothetical protein